MKLIDYNPTFRNVLLREVKVTKTRGGIILPSTEYANGLNSKVYEVIKAGKDCIEIQPGDLVKLTAGVYPDAFQLEDGGKDIDVGQIFEQQVIGYERKKKKTNGR